jgi:hypothetical protein
VPAEKVLPGRDRKSQEVKLFDDRPDLGGRIPPAAKCGSCSSFTRIEWHGKTYFKCALRNMTHGAGTDIRKSDGACHRWTPIVGERSQN